MVPQQSMGRLFLFMVIMLVATFAYTFFVMAMIFTFYPFFAR